MGKSPFYLFYGSETFLIEQEINNIIEKLIPKEERDLNTNSYDLSGTPLAEVIEEAETLPFFSSKKVIIAKNAFFFSAQRPPKSIEQDTDSLKRLLDNPVDFSYLIFWAPVEKVDERKKIVKMIKKQGNVKSFSSLTGSHLVEWVKNTVLEDKANITDDAAGLLIHTIGQNLQLISQEIKKMAIYVGENGLIDKTVVRDLSSRTLEQNIFLLIEMVANLEFERAFRTLYDLLKNKEEPIKIVTLFARQFRIMLYAKELNRIGYSGKQIASHLGVHPYAVKLALRQSSRFTEVQLRNILKKTAELDYEMKTGAKDKKLSLEMFIFYLKGLVDKKENINV